MNLLDRLIEPFAPNWAMQRAIARHTLDSFRAAYDGAKPSRQTRGWSTPSSSANTEIRGAGGRLRDRSRDAVRNNSWARAAIDIKTAYEVGTGIVSRSATGDKTLDKEIDALWKRFAEHADLAGRCDLSGLQALAARCRSESGEALLQYTPLTAAEFKRSPCPVPLQISVLEPDYIDSSRQDSLADGAIAQGVEVDALGRTRAYWVFDNHPGDYGFGTIRGFSSRRIPAAYMRLLYRQERPGQLRGVPDLSPVLARLNTLSNLEAAALEAARVQSCLAAFVTSSAAPGAGPLEGRKDAASGERRRSLAPGMIERLMPGEAVSFNSPPPFGGFSDMAMHELRAISAALGIPYDLVTGDLRQANYSSLRAGRLAFKRGIEQYQWGTLIPGMVDPIWQAFINAGMAAGVIPYRSGKWPVKHMPPRVDMLDPAAEYAAIKEGMRNGLMTWAQAVSEQGHDPAEQLEEIADWNGKMDAVGVILDSDARRLTNAGLAHDPKQLAHVEIAAQP